MNYKNREQYKHLMRVLAVAAIVLLECAVFSVFWDRYYASHLWLEPFWDKGNQIIVVIYGIFLLVFMYIYGGMKIGYMKGSSIIYSQMMTAFCANALMYLQIILLWRHLPYILPMVGMTLVDFALAGIVSWLFEKTFARLFPPREVLLIYGEYPMESLELKMNQRPDKYIVAHKVSVEVGEKELCRQIDAYGQEGRDPGRSSFGAAQPSAEILLCERNPCLSDAEAVGYYGTESGSAPYFRYTASARAKQWSFV